MFRPRFVFLESLLMFFCLITTFKKGNFFQRKVTLGGVHLLWFGDGMKILFICSANVNRSKAFEREFKLMYERPKSPINPELIEIRSAGIYSYSGYGYKLDKKILEWADLVFVMTQAHKMFLHKAYSEYLDKVHVIGISDEYDVDDEALKVVIAYWHDTIFKQKHLNNSK